AKVEPLTGLHVTLTPGQLSAAVAMKITLLFEHRPGSVSATMSAGRAMPGGSRSRTVTVKVQLLRLLAASVAVQVTVVTPLANVEPLGGLHVTVTPGQLSVAVAV